MQSTNVRIIFSMQQKQKRSKLNCGWCPSLNAHENPVSMHIQYILCKLSNIYISQSMNASSTAAIWVRNQENSQYFEIRVGYDALSQHRMVSCFSAPHPPINKGLGWDPNKTIFPLPGMHLRLYCEQRSAAAGTERFEAEIILSAISYKYLTEKEELGRDEDRGMEEDRQGWWLVFW